MPNNTKDRRRCLTGLALFKLIIIAAMVLLFYRALYKYAVREAGPWAVGAGGAVDCKFCDGVGAS